MARVRDAAATRERLLTSARQCFFRQNYESVSLREVATGAGVDVALIARYFGSKEELFRAVLRSRDGDWLGNAAAAPDLPAYLAGLVSSPNSKGSEEFENLLIMLRSVASPAAAHIVQTTFSTDVLEPFAKVLKDKGVEAERGGAAMAISVMLGTTIVRSIMKLEGSYECDEDAFQARLAEVLAVALKMSGASM